MEWAEESIGRMNFGELYGELGNVYAELMQVADAIGEDGEDAVAVDTLMRRYNRTVNLFYAALNAQTGEVADAEDALNADDMRLFVPLRLRLRARRRLHSIMGQIALLKVRNGL